jgi:hypothetical protein
MLAIVTQWYYITILHYIISWDHRRICGPSLTETSLCGAWLHNPRRWQYRWLLKCFTNLSQLAGAHPRRGRRKWVAVLPPNRNVKTTDFVYTTISNILRDSPFTWNQPLTSTLEFRGDNNNNNNNNNNMYTFFFFTFNYLCNLSVQPPVLRVRMNSVRPSCYLLLLLINQITNVLSSSDDKFTRHQCISWV